MHKQKAQGYQQLALHVSFVTIIENLILSAFKFFAGILAHSGAMLSDAVHSASDVATTVVVIIGVKLAGKQPDKDHPYGHERLESVAAILLAAVLAATGAGIGWSGLAAIFYGGRRLAVPGTLALIAALVSIAVKEAMYWYTRAAAKKLSSPALMADAWHHRSDAFSSIGSFAGILGAQLGLPILDPIASVVICLFILKAAFCVFRDAVSRLTDRSCPPETEEAIRRTALSQQGVLGLERMRTRCFGSRAYVDLDIQATGASTLQQAHAIGETVHRAVESRFPIVKHCMVHISPAE